MSTKTVRELATYRQRSDNIFKLTIPNFEHSKSYILQIVLIYSHIHIELFQNKHTKTPRPSLIINTSFIFLDFL